jgi:hypothetical protein
MHPPFLARRTARQMLLMGVGEPPMKTILIATLLAAGLAGGCVARTHARGTVVVSSGTPDLVYDAPGVQVIADYDEPIFYADGFYWWYVDGYWYRSSAYTDGWIYVDTPPVVIVRIHEPHRYRHYRPHGYVVRHRPAPSRTIKRPAVREHRSTRPKVRDHRR